MTLFTPSDGIARCGWCAASEDYIAYHDREWGFPVADDRRLFVFRLVVVGVAEKDEAVIIVGRAGVGVFDDQIEAVLVNLADDLA